MDRPHRASALLCLALAGACAPETYRPRPVVLVSGDRAVDAAMNQARQSAMEGDLEHAASGFRAVIAHHPYDPLAAVASLWLAQIAYAQGATDEAVRRALATDVHSDPSLLHTRDLVLGLAALRRAHPHEALLQLRPIDGRLPDRGQSGELACGLADAEAQAGEPSRALREIALAERIASEGVAWLPTGLSCEQPESRLALAARVLARADDPAALAAALDALPAQSPLRRPIAVRLRDLAVARRETGRWLAWLADLPDDSAANAPVGGDTRPTAVVLGVLGPLSGPRASAGVAIVRGAQYAVEGLDNVRVDPEDEGDSPETAAAALERLVLAGARYIVGVSRDDFAAAAAIRAQSLGVDLWLISPARGVEGAGPRVHLAGPALEAREQALVAAVRGRGPRVLLHAPRDGGDVGEVTARELSGLGLDVVRTETALEPPAGAVAVGAGVLARELATQLARASEREPTRWIFEARSAMPGAHGVLVGVAPGPGFAAVLPRFCARVGAPPEELALLAYDAASAAIASARTMTAAPPTVLAPAWPEVAAEVSATSTIVPSASVPAAATRCPPAGANDE